MKSLSTVDAADYDVVGATSADVANNAFAAACPNGRPGLFRLMECRLLHRAHWYYVGTRLADDTTPWPIDTYGCDHCNRTWENMGTSAA